MQPQQILDFMNQYIKAKVDSDIDKLHLPYKEQSLVSFPTFVYDKMILEHGFITKTVKILMQLHFGFK